MLQFYKYRHYYYILQKQLIISFHKIKPFSIINISLNPKALYQFKSTATVPCDLWYINTLHKVVTCRNLTQIPASIMHLSTHCSTTNKEILMADGEILPQQIEKLFLDRYGNCSNMQHPASNCSHIKHPGSISLQDIFFLGSQTWPNKQGWCRYLLNDDVNYGVTIMTNPWRDRCWDIAKYFLRLLHYI